MLCVCALGGVYTHYWFLVGRGGGRGGRVVREMGRRRVATDKK